MEIESKIGTVAGEGFREVLKALGNDAVECAMSASGLTNRPVTRTSGLLEVHTDIGKINSKPYLLGVDLTNAPPTVLDALDRLNEAIDEWGKANE